MKSIILGVIPIILVIGSAVQGQIPVGRSINYPVGTQRTQDGLPIHQRSYADSRLAYQSTRRNTPSHDENGLSLYEDFVNDPWKPTEDLGTLLSQRTGDRQNQLRSGGSHDSRDDIWSRRQPLSHTRHSPTQSPPAHQRPFQPIYGNEGNAYWEVSSRDDNQITYKRRGHYAPNPAPAVELPETRGVESSWRSGAAGSRSGVTGTTRSGNWESRSPPSQDDDTWIVDSRSDGHITYRKRISSQSRGPAGVHGWRTPGGSSGVRTLGHGDGKVLARVVNTATDNDDAFATVHGGYTAGKQFGSSTGRRSGLASYKSMRSSYAHDGDDDSSGRSRLQLKSADYVSYRGKDGSEAVFNRYRQPTTTTTPPPAHYEQEGDWRVVSKDDSHITWSRVGSEIESSTVPPVQHRSGRYYSSGPHYPMMRERAFAERDNRLGASNVLAV